MAKTRKRVTGKSKDIVRVFKAGQIREAIRDILGVVPKEITIEFDKDQPRPPLGPGGIRAGDGSWDGNIYKYRY